MALHLAAVFVAWWLVSMMFLDILLPKGARLAAAHATAAAYACSIAAAVFTLTWLGLLLPLHGNSSRIGIIRRIGALSLPGRIPIAVLLAVFLYVCVSVVEWVSR
jgi:hypothetical protein